MDTCILIYGLEANPAYRSSSDSLYALLSSFPRLERVPPSLVIADTAARLRAQWRWSTPGAVQFATALNSGATAWLSNDAAFLRGAALEVLLLDDFS